MRLIPRTAGARHFYDDRAHAESIEAADCCGIALSITYVNGGPFVSHLVVLRLKAPGSERRYTVCPRCFTRLSLKDDEEPDPQPLHLTSSHWLLFASYPDLGPTVDALLAHRAIVNRALRFDEEMEIAAVILKLPRATDGGIYI